MHSFQIHLLGCSCSIIISPQLVPRDRPVLTHPEVEPESSTPREIQAPPTATLLTGFLPLLLLCVGAGASAVTTSLAPMLGGTAQQLLILTSSAVFKVVAYKRQQL